MINILDHVAHDGESDTVALYRLIKPRTTFDQQLKLIFRNARPIIDDFKLETWRAIRRLAARGFHHHALTGPLTGVVSEIADDFHEVALIAKEHCLSIEFRD